MKEPTKNQRASSTPRAWRIAALVVVFVLGLGAALAWTNRSPRESETHKVAFYQDSMHPWVKSDKPGKCTICAMDLTPIYAGDKGFEAGDGLVALSSNSITVLHVQTEEVKRQALRRTLRVAGTLEANESRKTIIAAPTPARVKSLAVGYVGVEVQEGQPLVSLFSPQLVQQRRSFFASYGGDSGTSSNVLSRGALGGDPFSGEIVAPQSGVVVERNISPGQFVAEGEKLLTIVDASVLWFRFDVYEGQLPWLHLGQNVEVSVSAVPGKKFTSVISFIEPTLNDSTRTIKVRADIRNPVGDTDGSPHRLLRFGMYAEGRVRADASDVLAVPRTAILFPGGSAYAYVDVGGSAYERRRLKLGRQGDDFWEVLSGLNEGDRVVTSGNVLIDAQAQFQQAKLDEDDGEEPEETTSAEPAEVEKQEGEGLIGAMMVAATIDGSHRDCVAHPAGQAQSGPMAQMPTEPTRPEPSMKSGSALRTARMAAVMSPGSELLKIRRAAILRELAQKTNGAAIVAEAALLTPDVMEQPGTIAIPADAASQAPSAQRTPVAANGVELYRKFDRARMASSREMREVRVAAMGAAPVGTSAKRPAEANVLSAARRRALEDFLGEANDISSALAADNLAQFNQHAARLSEVLPPLQREFAAPHAWQGQVQRLASTCEKVNSAKDLEEARKWFLPFSSRAVELVTQVRRQNPAFAKLMIYHCPMAPKPGLWMQAQGPLANPFYGAKMLRCGEEVKQ